MKLPPAPVSDVPQRDFHKAAHKRRRLMSAAAQTINQLENNNGTCTDRSIQDQRDWA